ncbi:MAG: TonB-dependent receptor, partial [Bacteroidales bacterium]|nr:TonB-dependent receptor [Bacteroidales bacterium]
MQRPAITLVLILLLLPTVSLSQSITVSGKIADKQTGEVLPDAHIWFPKQRNGFRSDEEGKFKLMLPAQTEYDIIVSYVGYSKRKFSFSAQSDTLINIFLEQDNALNNIVVYGSKNDFGVKHTQMSAIEMPIAKIEYVPAVFGEVDVLKALQTLPGVQSASDGHAGIFVRGGGYDQNQITLDGAMLYNAEHLKGFISAINSDMVESLVFYKGAFPARYGGQLSSIVDIGIKEGDMDNFHGEATIGALSSKIQFEGPLDKGRTSFNVAARASYLDLIVQPALKKIANNENAMTPYANLNFYDASAKITHLVSNKHKLSAYFYMGKDKSEETPTSNSSHTEAKDAAWKMITFTDRNGSSNSINNWGNIASSLSWLYIPEEDLSFNTTLSFSKYDYYLKYQNKSYTKSEEFYWDTGDFYALTITDIDNYTEHNSGIKEYSASFGSIYKHSQEHDFRFGSKVSVQTFNPSIHLFQNKYTYTKRLDLDSEDTTIINTTTGRGTESLSTVALYAEDEISFNRYLKANAGLRYVMFAIKGKFYHSLEPRLSLRYMLSDNQSLKISYARMAQAMHMLSSTNLVSPSDIWVPITKKIPPMKSDQFALGYNFEPKEGIELSLEGYYKTMDNLLEYKDGASFVTSGENWDNIVALGKGKSYGVELYAQKDIGKTTGWISYTWSRSLRTFNRSGEELNGGKSFYSGTDRRHNFNIVANHKFSNRFDISLSWTFQSGRRGNITTTSYISGIEG